MSNPKYATAAAFCNHMKSNDMTTHCPPCPASNDSHRTRRLKILAPFFIAIVAASPAPAAQIIRLGFYDAPYTDSGGKQISRLSDAQGSLAIGDSDRFNGIVDLGRAAWVADARSGVTTRVGFFDPAFTVSGGSQNGLQFSASRILDGDTIAGFSRRYSGTMGLGDATWVANAITGATTRVGLFGANYTNASGVQSSSVFGLLNGFAWGTSFKFNLNSNVSSPVWMANVSTGVTARVGFFDSGYTQDFSGYQESRITSFQGRYAAGTSVKYNGGREQGTAAWVADALTGVTTRVGFFGSEYTQVGGSDPGRQFSGGLLDQSGYVAGSSAKFNGEFSNGSAAWVMNVTGGPTTRIGFYGSEYTDAQNGYQISQVSRIDGGYVAGTSQKYDGTRSQVAWLANATTAATTRVGLIGAEFTANGGSQNGYQSSEVTHLQSGYAGGHSTTFSGSTEVGTASWLADAATGLTKRVGLMGAASTTNDRISILNDGYAAGFSTKQNGASFNGNAAWVANADTGVTARVGLFDNRYTQVGGSDDGYQFSGVSGIVGGYAYGFSQAFSGTTYNGDTAWIYDLDDNVLNPIMLSQRGSDGYSNSYIIELSQNGLALGGYTLFDQGGAELGDRAFIWTPADGALDLGSLISGGLSEAGWSLLSAAHFADPITGTIYGYGNLLGGTTDSLAVYAVVPEPGGVILLLLGATTLWLRRRERSLPL